MTDNKTAIMFTDIVGYSSMMGRDESYALKLLSEHNEIVEPTIKQYGGKIIKHIGDSIFAKFNDSANSIQSAINFQSKLFERNRLTRDKDKIKVRVGIHFANVVEKDGDLFGNDVNVTSRIESSSPVEGIAISSDLFSSVSSDKNLFVRKMGYVKLKNIRNPYNLYKVYLNKDEYNSETDENLFRDSIDRGLNIVDIEKYEVLNTYSLAMLDILDESANEDNQKYADFLTEDIISDFQTINDLRVPIRKNSHRSALDGLDHSQIAFKLKVNNILECKLDIYKSEITFSANLFSNMSGDIVWEDSWKCKKENTHFIRQKLLIELSKYFGIDLPEKIQDSLSTDMTSNTVALKKYIDARALLDKLQDTPSLQEASNLLKEASSLDEDFVEAHAKYAFTCMRLGKYDKCEEILDDALDIADDLDNERGKIEVYNSLGTLYGQRNKIKKAQRNLEKSLEILKDFNDQSMESRVLYNLAGVMYMSEQPDLALTYLDRSKELKINLEEIETLPLLYGLYGNIYTIIGDNSKAIEYRNMAIIQGKELSINLNLCRNLVAVAGNYQRIADYDKAEFFLKEAYELDGSPFEKGKIPLIQARIAIERQNYDIAEELLKKSEEEFQKSSDTRLLIQVYMELSDLYMLEKKSELFNKYIELWNHYAGKIRGFDLALLPQCMDIYFNNKSEFDLEDIEKKLIEDYKHPQFYKQWYYISHGFINNGYQDKAKKYLNFSKDLLIKLSKINSLESHQKSMISGSFINHAILDQGF